MFLSKELCQCWTKQWQWFKLVEKNMQRLYHIDCTVIAFSLVYPMLQVLLHSKCNQPD